MVAAYHMENSYVARITLIISYAVKQYLKLDKLQMLRYLRASLTRYTTVLHQVVNQFIVTSQFVYYLGSRLGQDQLDEEMEELCRCRA
jgi:hypothetical protein